MQLQLFVLGQQQLQQQLLLNRENTGGALPSLHERPRIADRFTVIPVSAKECRLHSLASSLVLKSEEPELLERLLAMLHGRASIQTIIDALEQFGPDSIIATLQSLDDAGVLEFLPAAAGDEAKDEDRFRSQIAFFSHFVAPPNLTLAGSPVGPVPQSGVEYQERLKRAHVAVFGLGRIGSQLVRALTLAGVGAITGVDSRPLTEDDRATDGWFDGASVGTGLAEVAAGLCCRLNPELMFRTAEANGDPGSLQGVLQTCDFAVLCPDAVNPAEHEEFNKAALAARRSWISARRMGFEFQIGPTVVPNETPCYECFRLRINSNVDDYAEHLLIEDYRRHAPLREPALAITPAAGLFALEVLKAITWFAVPATYAHLYSLNLLTMQSELHPILRIPRCPACGRPAAPRPTIHAWQQTRSGPLS